MPLARRHNSASCCPTPPSVASMSVSCKHVRQLQARPSPKRALDCPTWGSVRRQAQTGGRITRAQFGSGLGIALFPTVDNSFSP